MKILVSSSIGLMLLSLIGCVIQNPVQEASKIIVPSVENLPYREIRIEIHCLDYSIGSQWITCFLTKLENQCELIDCEECTDSNPTFVFYTRYSLEVLTKTAIMCAEEQDGMSFIKIEGITVWESK